MATARPIIGWREWVGLPDLGIKTIKVKVDTGARTSTLHAFEVVEFRRGQQRMVRFQIHPEQKRAHPVISAEAPLVDHRSVRSSSGRAERRPVIVTTIEVGGDRWEVELTLTRRDEMGFRMLLGRQAIRGRFAVDPGISYQNGRRIKGTHRLKKKVKRPR
ncbi:MAG: ATP-dependent zinc protease [Planctomycetes bacterium]|nr:ATP-dependent zinc protease [Planctomycetota bacterium]